MTPNRIELYWHCAQCIDELPAGVSPGEYASIAVGWTPDGVQAWCTRHDCSIYAVKAEVPEGLTCSDCGEPMGGHHAHH